MIDNIAYNLRQAGYRRTSIVYNTFSQYAAASFAGRALTTNFDGNNTVITLMHKQLPGFQADDLSSTQAAVAKFNRLNVFASYNNGTAIVQHGTVSSGDFVDTITGLDWLSTEIQTQCFNALYQSTTKIPQTDDGVHMLVSVIERVLNQGVENGLIAPGTWNAVGFGTLQQGDFLPTGWYVYAQPVDEQSQQDREDRVAPPIRVAVKLAGAIHTMDVSIDVNR